MRGLSFFRLGACLGNRCFYTAPVLAIRRRQGGWGEREVELLAKAFSGAVYGVDAYAVEIEVTRMDPL